MKRKFIKINFCIKQLFLILFLGLNFGLLNQSKAQENEVFLLNWQNIIAESQKNAPTLERIRANLLSAQFNKNQYLENFEAKLDGEVSRYKTNENPFIPFMPTVSQTSKFSIGVSKNFASGFNLGLKNKSQKDNYNGFGVDARNIISLELSMDLYKNFFGRDSKARISYFDYEEKIAGIQKQIDEEMFLVNLNRIYTFLILNEEAIKISNEILKTYQKQESDAKNRYKDGIADLSEVKRRSTQVASKKVDILNLNNKKENLILNLKELLPSLALKDVQLAKYDLKKQEEFFVKVIDDIRKQRETPLDYTSYDEIVALIDKSYQQQKKFTKNYSDVDLKLYSSFDHFGRDKNIRGAIDNSYKLPQDSYEIGLRASMPIGGVKSDSRDLQLSLQTANFVARKKENLAKIESYHNQSIKNLELLIEAEKFQEQNTKDLKSILNLSETKYYQARITVKDLIEDQNFYLESLLREIDIKTVIFDQVLNYMTIFTTMPKALNNPQNNG